MDFGIEKKVRGKHKKRLGLDIGSYAIKILEISEGGDRPVISAIGYKRIEKASKETAAAALKECIDEAKVSAKEATIAVSGPSVIVRFISMPMMSEEELKGAVRFEAEKFIPFNINDCLTDFQILGTDKTEKKSNILLVAAKKDIIMEKMELAQGAGLLVPIIDVDDFALTNSFLKNFPDLEKDKTIALINIGARSTSLSMVTAGAISFVRDIAIGSGNINTAMSKMMSMDIQAAEEVKIAPKEKAQDVINCARAVLNNLFDDIKLSFSYHENQSGKGVDEVYISGGAVMTIGMEGLFQETFDSTPVLWNPLQFLSIDTASDNAQTAEKFKDSFAIAAGLALR